MKAYLAGVGLEIVYLQIAEMAAWMEEFPS